MRSRLAADRGRRRCTDDRRIAEAASDWTVKAGAANRIRETGWLKAWRSDAVEAAKREQALLTELASKAGCSTARPFPRSSRASCDL